MPSITNMQITGYKGRDLPNTLFTDPKNERAAMVLPGMGYTCSMPLLYYTTELLLQHGYDVLCVDYAYNKRAPSDLPAAELKEWLYGDVDEAYQALMKRKQYKDMLVVGKSIGTLGAAHLLSSGRAANIKLAIWLTPLMDDENLIEMARKTAGNVRSIFIIGSADPHFNRHNLEELTSALDAGQLIVDSANHSLEMEGDYETSISTIRTMMGHIEGFLGSNIY